MDAEAVRRAAAADARDFDAAGALAELARPRLVGTRGWTETHALVGRLFTERGWDVRVLPCEVSTLPGRWGLPAAGLVLMAASLGGALALQDGARLLAFGILGAGGAATAAIALFAARATDGWKYRRVELRNLWIQRPGARPRWVFCAHLDSKSQLVPLLLRASAAGTAIGAWLGLLAIALLGGPPARSATLLDLLSVIAIMAGAALLLCGAGNGSPGALDNASGVATLLGLAERESEAPDLALLVTDGEEIGLAGSRGIARSLPPVEGIINIDGIDDGGPFHVLERFGRRRRGRAPHLAMPLLKAADALGWEAHRRDVPLGLLLDHISFVRAGIPALTLMRGTFRSMMRVHRPADDLEHLSGSGIRDAVRLLSGALAVLRGTEGGGPGGVAGPAVPD